MDRATAPRITYQDFIGQLKEVSDRAEGLDDSTCKEIGRTVLNGWGWLLPGAAKMGGTIKEAQRQVARDQIVTLHQSISVNGQGGLRLNLLKLLARVTAGNSSVVSLLEKKLGRDLTSHILHRLPRDFDKDAELLQKTFGVLSDWTLIRPDVGAVTLAHWIGTRRLSMSQVLPQLNPIVVTWLKPVLHYGDFSGFCTKELLGHKSLGMLISQFSHIRVLKIESSDCISSDKIDFASIALTELEELRLEKLKLPEAAIRHIGSLPKLQTLTLTGCLMNGHYSFAPSEERGAAFTTLRVLKFISSHFLSALSHHSKLPHLQEHGGSLQELKCLDLQDLNLEEEDVRKLLTWLPQLERVNLTSLAEMEHPWIEKLRQEFPKIEIVTLTSTRA